MSIDGHSLTLSTWNAQSCIYAKVLEGVKGDIKT